MDIDNERRPNGADKRAPKIQRVMRASTAVGAAWIADARRPPIKKRSGRKKIPSPTEDARATVPWIVQNWSSAAAVVAALFSLGSFLHAGGWLSSPAKQDDLIRISEHLAQLEKRTSEADARITSDVLTLTTELREQRNFVAQFGNQLSRTEGKLDEALRGLIRVLPRGRSTQNN